MMRILSILLLLAGMLAAGVGGAALLDEYAPQAPAAAPVADSSVAEETVEAASAPAPESAELEIASVDNASAPDEVILESAPEEPLSSEAMPEPVEKMARTESMGAERALTEEETGFMFQTQMEEAPPPAAMSAPPEARSMSADSAEAGPAAVIPSPKQSFEDMLKTVPVAHETPASAEYKRPFNVTFAIDSTGDTTAADALPGRGVIEEGEAKVSERVEVRLSGATFAIEQTSPPIQTLSPLTENTWRWSVTPLTAGDHDLTFEIFAIDSDAVTPLRTYRDTVTVKVSGLNRAIAFADQANPLFVLLGGLGSILAGLFGVVRFFSKR